MEKYSFFNADQLPNGEYDRSYNASDWAEYFKSLINTGIAQGQGQGLSIEKDNGMNIIVNSGIAYINGYRYSNTSPLTLNITQANSTYSRITSIVLELNLTKRLMQVIAIDGTPAPTPQPQDLIRNETIYQLQLATLLIPAGAVSIANITDTRESLTLCGYLTLNAPAAQNNIIEIGPQGYSFNNEQGTEIANITENNFNFNNIPTFNNEQLFQGGEPNYTNGLSGTISLNGVSCYFNVDYWVFNTQPLINGKLSHAIGAVNVSITPTQNLNWAGICNINLKQLEAFKGLTFLTATYHPIFAIDYNNSINCLTLNNNIEPEAWSNGSFAANTVYAATALIIG